jgi:thiol-disulfide isomerase/thioredoxin
MNRKARVGMVWLTGVLLLSLTIAWTLIKYDTTQKERAGETVIQLPTKVPTITPGPAPTLTLKTLEGEEITLEKWRGKGIILNFWATWCYPCRIEMPDLAAVHEANEDIIVVGVNYFEDAEKARAFREEYNLPFPIILDEKGWLIGEMNVKALPTTYFINPEGQLIGSHIGPLNEEALMEMVERLRNG